MSNLFPPTRPTRKYRMVQNYQAPDLAHASVFAVVAQARGPVTRTELSEGVARSVTPEEYAAAVHDLLDAGMIAEMIRPIRVRQTDGRVKFFEEVLYRLGPKAVRYV